jgi:tetratricopeptide (TPR) repeat protein
VFSINNPKLKSIGKDIIEGRNKQALETINSLLDSEMKIVKEKVNLQILKILALINLGRFHKLEEYIDSVWNEIKEQGSEQQQLDLLLLKARYYVEDMITPPKKLHLAEQIEEMIKESEDIESIHYQQRYAFFLIYRFYLTQLREEDASQRKLNIENALKISEEINFEYGIVLSIIHGDWNNPIEYLERALNICKRNNYLFLLGSVYLKFAILNLVPNDSEALKAAFNYLKKAEKIFYKIDAKRNLAMIHSHYIFYYQILSDYTQTKKHLEISYEIAYNSGCKGQTVTNLHNLGTLHLMKMEYSKALPYFEQGLELSQELELIRWPTLFLRGLGIIHTQQGEFNKALKVLHAALENSLKRENIVDTASLKGCLMIAYLAKGDLEKALEFSSAIDHIREKENPWLFSEFIRYKGEILQMKGEYEDALVCLSKSVEVSKSFKNDVRIAEAYFSLLLFYLEQKDLEKANQTYQLLESTTEKVEEMIVQSRVLIAKALLLRNSVIRDERLESKKILEDVILIPDLKFDLLVITILNLCELLLLEIKEEENPELLIQLSNITEELHVRAIQHNVFHVIAQTLWLQSQIALLNLDVTKARILMTKAQAFAEEKNLEKLAIRISNDHDIVLEQLDLWDNMLKELPVIAERLDLTHIETILEEMIKGKGIVVEESEREEETPVLLFITSEKGSILYSEQFDTNLDIKIINEILPEIMNRKQEDIDITTIDRSMYQEYNYLLKRFGNVSFCYLFIGKSYEGMKKLNQFSELVFESSQIWSQLTSDSDTTPIFESTTRNLLNQYVDKIFSN